jgi:glyoxylate reductase
MNWRVYITRKIPEVGVKRLKERCEKVLLSSDDRIPTEDEIIEGAKGKDGILCLLTDPITKRVIDNLDSIKAISNYAVGYDNIDVDYATEKGIIVTNTPGVLTNATAELTWALILAAARRINEADNFVRESRFKGWGATLLLGTEIKGKTLGIIGAGRIGTEVGLKSKGFDMQVVYTDISLNTVLEKQVGAKRVAFNELLKMSDFVTIHVPLTSETHHLIGKEEFKIMKNSAYLINTSRGSVVDESALIEAIENGEIKGAGLDVYEEEPRIPVRLRALTNVVLLPHIGSATVDSRNKMAILAAENLISALEGHIPSNIVNREVLNSNCRVKLR